MVSSNEDIRKLQRHFSDYLIRDLWKTRTFSNVLERKITERVVKSWRIFRTLKR